jgi:hypothetical protein
VRLGFPEDPLNGLRTSIHGARTLSTVASSSSRSVTLGLALVDSHGYSDRRLGHRRDPSVDTYSSA